MNKNANNTKSRGLKRSALIRAAPTTRDPGAATVSNRLRYASLDDVGRAPWTG